MTGTVDIITKLMVETHFRHQHYGMDMTTSNHLGLFGYYVLGGSPSLFGLGRGPITPLGPTMVRTDRKDLNSNKPNKKQRRTSLKSLKCCHDLTDLLKNERESLQCCFTVLCSRVVTPAARLEPFHGTSAEREIRSGSHGSGSVPDRIGLHRSRFLTTSG